MKLFRFQTNLFTLSLVRDPCNLSLAWATFGCIAACFHCFVLNIRAPLPPSIPSLPLLILICIYNKKKTISDHLIYNTYSVFLFRGDFSLYSEFPGQQFERLDEHVLSLSF